jgi:hypothetical protein
MARSGRFEAVAKKAESGKFDFFCLTDGLNCQGAALMDNCQGRESNLVGFPPKRVADCRCPRLRETRAS